MTVNGASINGNEQLAVWCNSNNVTLQVVSGPQDIGATFQDPSRTAPNELHNILAGTIPVFEVKKKARRGKKMLTSRKIIWMLLGATMAALRCPDSVPWVLERDLEN